MDVMLNDEAIAKLGDGVPDRTNNISNNVANSLHRVVRVLPPTTPTMADNEVDELTDIDIRAALDSRTTADEIVSSQGWHDKAENDDIMHKFEALDLSLVPQQDVDIGDDEWLVKSIPQDEEQRVNDWFAAVDAEEDFLTKDSVINLLAEDLDGLGLERTVETLDFNALPELLPVDDVTDSQLVQAVANAPPLQVEMDITPLESGSQKGLKRPNSNVQNEKRSVIAADLETHKQMLGTSSQSTSVNFVPTGLPAGMRSLFSLRSTATTTTSSPTHAPPTLSPSRIPRLVTTRSPAATLT